MNVKKILELVLKFNLVKAFDRVNWVLLRLALLQIGLPLDITDWITGYVTSASFVVLENGIPNQYLKRLEEVDKDAHFHLFYACWWWKD